MASPRKRAAVDASPSHAVPPHAKLARVGASKESSVRSPTALSGGARIEPSKENPEAAAEAAAAAAVQTQTQQQPPPTGKATGSLSYLQRTLSSRRIRPVYMGALSTQQSPRAPAHAFESVPLLHSDASRLPTTPQRPPIPPAAASFSYAAMAPASSASPGPSPLRSPLRPLSSSFANSIGGGQGGVHTPSPLPSHSAMSPSPSQHISTAMLLTTPKAPTSRKQLLFTPPPPAPLAPIPSPFAAAASAAAAAVAASSTVATAASSATSSSPSSSAFITPLPANYLHFLSEAQRQQAAAAAASAGNAFASSYSRRPAHKPSLPNSTWSSFRFDAHAFSSTTSSASASQSVGVTLASSPAAAPTASSAQAQQAPKPADTRSSAALMEELEAMARKSLAAVGVTLDLVSSSSSQMTTTNSSSNSSSSSTAISNMPPQQLDTLDLPLPDLPRPEGFSSPMKNALSLATQGGIPPPLIAPVHTPAAASHLSAYASPAASRADEAAPAAAASSGRGAKSRRAPHSTSTVRTAPTPYQPHAPAAAAAASASRRRPSSLRAARSSAMRSLQYADEGESVVDADGNLINAAPVEPLSTRKVRARRTLLPTLEQQAAEGASAADAAIDDAAGNESDSSVQASLAHTDAAPASAPRPSADVAAPDVSASTDSPFTAAQYMTLRSQMQLHMQLLFQTLWLSAVVPTAPPNRKTMYKPVVPHAHLHTQCRALLEQINVAALGVTSAPAAAASSSSSSPSPSPSVSVSEPAPAPSAVPSAPPSPAASSIGSTERDSALALLDMAAMSAEPVLPPSSAPRRGPDGEEGGSATKLMKGGRRARSSRAKAPNPDDEEEMEGPVAPYSMLRPIELTEGKTIPLLRVPALLMWREDEELKAMQPVAEQQAAPIAPSAASDDETLESHVLPSSSSPSTVLSPSSSSSTLPSTPVASFALDPTDKRVRLRLDASAVESFWKPRLSLSRYGLDRRFGIKFNAHERHLFSVAEEHLWRRGLEVLQWRGGHTARDAAAAAAEERTLCAHMRRRFLPSKTIAQLRVRLAKEEQKGTVGAAAAFAASAAAASIGGGGAGKLHPRALQLLPSVKIEEVAASKVFPRASRPTAKKLQASGGAALASLEVRALPGSGSSVTASPAQSEAPPAATAAAAASSSSPPAPVVLLRPFTPSELVLAGAGWNAHKDCKKDKWALISANFLPHWPRKLLAKAWDKHTKALANAAAAAAAGDTATTTTAAGKRTPSAKKQQSGAATAAAAADDAAAAATAATAAATPGNVLPSSAFDAMDIEIDEE